MNRLRRSTAERVAVRLFRPAAVVLLAAALGAVSFAPVSSASADTVAGGTVKAVTSNVETSNGAFGSGVTSRQLRAAGYELAAWAEGDGRRINLWVIQGHAGAWTWHGHLERGRPGDHVWTENTWGNVVSSAHVPQGKTGVNTGDWSSRGTFYVCGKGVDRPSGFCSSAGSRG